MIVCLEKKAYLRAHFIVYMSARQNRIETNIQNKTIKLN